MLISVHVPKTAGTSFRKWLESAYGAERIMWDYEDRAADPTSAMNVDRVGFLARWREFQPAPEVAVIHGHFWAKKYEHLAARRITFLRDPIDRAISHFFFWKTWPYDGRHALHRAFLERDMGIVEFVKLPQIANFYNGLLFASVDMNSFDFVGDYARLDMEVQRLEKLLGRRGSYVADNRNAYPGYEMAKEELLSDRSIRIELETSLADDRRFYERFAGR